MSGFPRFIAAIGFVFWLTGSGAGSPDAIRAAQRMTGEIRRVMRLVSFFVFTVSVLDG